MGIICKSPDAPDALCAPASHRDSHHIISARRGHWSVPQPASMAAPAHSLQGPSRAGGSTDTGPSRTALSGAYRGPTTNVRMATRMGMALNHAYPSVRGAIAQSPRRSSWPRGRQRSTVSPALSAGAPFATRQSPARIPWVAPAIPSGRRARWWPGRIPASARPPRQGCGIPRSSPALSVGYHRWQ